MLGGGWSSGRPYMGYSLGTNVGDLCMMMRWSGLSNPEGIKALIKHQMRS